MTLTLSKDGESDSAVDDVDLDVLPLAGRIGAEIVGVDLADATDAEIRDVRTALLAKKVLFFRDQHLDVDSHARLAARFGPLTKAHPTIDAVDGAPDVMALDSENGARANSWHTDVTFTDRPPAISILRGIIFPPAGGDTMWANTAEAYVRLPESLRLLADNLKAVHTNAYDYARWTAPGGEAEKKRRERFVSTVFETEHPVVRVHPETGERSLLLGSFTQQIVGLTSQESVNLIGTLQARITAPENVVRWRWREGDVAMWDNRATQHYAIADYGRQRRRVERVTVAGARPVGIDGSESRALRGDASGYSPLANV